MRIGVIGAMQIEVDNLKASMSDISTKEYSGVTYVCGTIGDKEVVAAVRRSPLTVRLQFSMSIMMCMSHSRRMPNGVWTICMKHI